MGEDIDLEHRRIADTMASVGPAALAGADDWTVADLAAHLHSQTMAGGLPVFLGRLLIARGVQLGDYAGSATQRAIARFRRRGFDASLEVLRGGVPRLLLHRVVAPVSLFEVWVHHDDVRRANGLSPASEPDTLGEAVAFALRYQRRALAGRPVDRSVSDGDLLRWLAGRPSPLPPHDPPLRF